MINLNCQQRDFLDRYYTECMRLEGGPATSLGAKHGFYYEHFKVLFDSYCHPWGGDFGVWGDLYPPVSASDEPLTFPWTWIQALEEQLKTEGITVSRRPRLKPVTDQAASGEGGNTALPSSG
jgi:hypothetical protein